MVKALSTVRIARSRRTSFTNVEETQEIDFALGLRQGIEIFAVEFGALEFILTPSSAFRNDWALMELHGRIGALEGGLDSFPADDTILNSSLIAAAVYQVQNLDGTTEAASSQGWITEKSWNFEQLIGKPYLTAQNLTMRGITKNSTMVVNGGQITIYYRYVSLSDAELAQQFALGR